MIECVNNMYILDVSPTFHETHSDRMSHVPNQNVNRQKKLGRGMTKCISPQISSIPTHHT